MPKVICDKCRKTVHFVAPDSSYLFLLCPFCRTTNLSESAKRALSAPVELSLDISRPISAHRPKSSRSMGVVGFATLAAAILLALLTYFAFLNRRGDLFPITLALMMVSLIVATLCLLVYLPPRLDSAAKLLLDEKGLHDLRPRPPQFYDWQDVNELQAEVSSRDNVIVGGILRFVWSSPRLQAQRVEINYPNLDPNFEEIYLAAQEHLLRTRVRSVAASSPASPNLASMTGRFPLDVRVYSFYRAWMQPMWLFLGGLFLLLLSPVMVIGTWNTEEALLIRIFAGACALGGAFLAYVCGRELFDVAPKLQIDQVGLTDNRFTSPRRWTWNEIQDLRLSVLRMNRETTAKLSFVAPPAGAAQLNERVELDLGGLNSTPEKIYRLVEERARLSPKLQSTAPASESFT